MMRMRVLPAVWSELFSSAAWYELERRGLGADLLDEAAATLDRIESDPRIFPRVRGGIRRAQLRRFPFGVFFEIFDDAIVIYCIIHLARDENAWTKYTS
jgi:hypothetical protein